MSSTKEISPRTADGENSIARTLRSVFRLTMTEMSCLLAALFFIGCGYLLFYGVRPSSPASVADVAKELMTEPGNISPEPQERYAYIGLILLSPLLVATSILLARWLQNGAKPKQPFLVYGALLFGGYIFVTDAFWQPTLPLAVGLPLTWCVLLATLGGFAVWVYFPRIRRALSIFGGLAAIATALSIVAMGLAWRILDAKSITNITGFIVHYDAAVYSIAQAANGDTCLVSFLPQYGCYSEFLAPFLRLMGVSTLSITTLLSLLQEAAILAIFLTAAVLMRSKFLLVALMLWAYPGLDRIWYHDPYYQYDPVRVLFPAFSMLLAMMWQRRQGLAWTIYLGTFAGAGLVWNLDTGAIVAVALLLLVAFGNATDASWQWRTLLRRSLPAAAYLASVIGTTTFIYLALSLKAGEFVIPARFLVYQTLFYGSGAYMLPMPPPPSLWTVYCAIAGVALVIFGLRVGRGPRDRNLEFIAFLAVLSLGLFSYYNGRSHFDTLSLTAWPFILLFFLLADRAWLHVPSLGKPVMAMSGLALAVMLAFGIAGLWARFPLVAQEFKENQQRASGNAPASLVYPDIEFIRAHVRPGERVAILAYNQATLFAETGTRSALMGPGISETLRKADADDQLRRLLNPDFAQVFLSYGLCCEDANYHYTGWVSSHMNEIRTLYALVGWSPSGDLMRLVRRDLAGSEPDLFKLNDEPLTGQRRVSDLKEGIAADQSSRWGRPLTFPRKWGVTSGKNFELQLQFMLAPAQRRFATLATNRGSGIRGFSLEMNSPTTAVLLIGTGAQYEVSSSITLKRNVPHSVTIRSREGKVSMQFDGVEVFGPTSLAMIDSSEGLWIGSAAYPGREVNGQLTVLKITGDLTAIPTE